MPQRGNKAGHDRMRESMFSILGNISGVKFLDLFCGSGIVGIEAASRGAAGLFCGNGQKKKGNTS